MSKTGKEEIQVANPQSSFSSNPKPLVIFTAKAIEILPPHSGIFDYPIKDPALRIRTGFHSFA
jgi:hypothetical protein